MKGSARLVARVVALLASLSIASLSTVVTQADVSLSIPSECGSERAFRTELDRLATPESESWNALSARIEAHEDGSFRLVIRTPAGTRELFDRDCRALYRAALVILAAQDQGAMTQAETVQDSFAQAETPQDPPMQLEATHAPKGGEATERAQPTDRAEPTEAPPKQRRAHAERPRELRVQTRRRSAASRRGPPPANSENRRRLQRPSYSVSLGAGGEWGLAPTVKATAAVGVGLQLRRWGMQWELRGTPPTSHQTVGEVGLSVHSLGTRLAASWAPVEFFHLLFGVSVSSLRASGVGVPEQDSDQVFLPALEGALQLRPLRLRHWGLELELRARYGLIRPAFEVDPEVIVFEAPRWGGAALFRTIYFF